MRSFTLLEVTIVVAIVALLAAVAIPRYANSVALRRVRAAAHRLTCDLNLAQRHARLTSTPHAATFDTATSTYRITGMADPDHPGRAYYDVDLGGEPYCARLTAVQFDTGTQITFSGYGVPSSAGTVTLCVGSHTATVTVDATTGQASYQ